MFFKREYNALNHLGYEHQLRISEELQRLSDKLPMSKTIFFRYPGSLSLIPGLAFSFMSWRAGFRGYNLIRYGRCRVTSAFIATIYPVFGSSYQYFGTQPDLVEPYRPESPWYYGTKFAITQQLSNLTILLGNVSACYIFATVHGTIPLPGKGLHEITGREILTDMVLARLKPYAKGLLITTCATSAVMFAVGFLAYNQSRSLLAMMNRNSLGLKEDTKFSPTCDKHQNFQ